MLAVFLLGSFIHSTSFLSTFYKAGPVLGGRNTTVNKTHRVPTFMIYNVVSPSVGFLEF